MWDNDEMPFASLRPGGAPPARSGALRAPTVGRRHRRPLVALALALVATGCGARGCARDARSSGPLLYVSDEEGGVVVAVDPAAGQVVARIPVGKRPRGLMLSRDGRRLYVALSGSPRGGPGVDESKLPPADRAADGIGIVDLGTRTLQRICPSGQDPETFDLSPDGQTLYVSNEETAELSAVDLAACAVRARAQVGHEPEGVTARPDGKIVYVTSEQDNEVTAVDSATMTAVATLPTGPRPRSLVLSADGATAFVATENGSQVTVLDVVANRPLATIPIHLDSPMPIGARPMGTARSPDGKTVYVTTGRGGSLAILDVATRRQLRSIDGVGNRPWGLALSADGTLAYTANGTSHDVAVVNLVTGNVDKRIRVGGLPWGVVLAR